MHITHLKLQPLLRLYGVGYIMVKTTEMMIIAATSWATLPFRLAARVLFMCHPIVRIINTMNFVTPIVEYWREREVAQ